MNDTDQPRLHSNRGREREQSISLTPSGAGTTQANIPCEEAIPDIPCERAIPETPAQGAAAAARFSLCKKRSVGAPSCPSRTSSTCVP
jgi:hypothetical protein